MIKKNASRQYDVQCDGPDCQELASTYYQECQCFSRPSYAVKASLYAGWQRCEENGIEHMYCPECAEKRILFDEPASLTVYCP